MRTPALLAAIMLILTLSPVLAQTGETRVPLTPGTVAPDFTATTLEGATISLGEMRGKVVVLNFFITWYRDAADHLRMLEDLYTAFAEQGMRLVSVSLDAGDRGIEDVRTILRDEEIAHPVISDPQQQVAALYGVRALPAIFIIDREGVIRHYHEGYTEGDDERLGALIAAAISGAEPPEETTAESGSSSSASEGTEGPSEPVCKCFRRRSQ